MPNTDPHLKVQRQISISFVEIDKEIKLCNEINELKSNEEVKAGLGLVADYKVFLRNITWKMKINDTEHFLQMLKNEKLDVEEILSNDDLNEYEKKYLDHLSILPNHQIPRL